MAKQTINLGTAANDGTGSNLRAAGKIINDNFTELYPVQVTGLTLEDDGWTSESGLYYYDLANAAIKANSFVEIIPINEDYLIVKAADILPEIDITAGNARIYAVNEPTDDIGITIYITTTS